MRVSWFAVLAAFGNLAAAGEAPRLEFEQMVKDFGAVEQLETVTGSFKFTNAGDSVLKLRQPSSNCGCTVPALKKDTLSPGETGELEFTWKIGLSRGPLQRTITVESNDPQAPQVVLTIKADSRQTYDIAPAFIMANVPAGGRKGDFSITVTRSDGKPLQIERVDSSQPWIVARIDPTSRPGDGVARVSVDVQGAGVPRRFNEFVHVFAAGRTDTPIASISVFGGITGEVTVSPERLLWSFTDSTDKRRAGVLERHLTIRSSTGKAFELKNAQSSIPELSVEVRRIDDGKAYDIVATLDDLVTSSLSGVITFDTSLTSSPRIEVPVEVNVLRHPGRGAAGGFGSGDALPGAVLAPSKPSSQ
jgi:Protein of unknown function (DUF1573)